jgi:hypothetical protein
LGGLPTPEVPGNLSPTALFPDVYGEAGQGVFLEKPRRWQARPCGFREVCPRHCDEAEGGDQLGFENTVSFREWIKDVSDLAYELERLAPALASDGPNPEYPWPRYNPEHAPIEHDFQVWRHMQSANGRCLWTMIDKVLENFDEWF